MPLDLASSLPWNVFKDNAGIQNPECVELCRTNGQFSSTTRLQGDRWEGIEEELQGNKNPDQWSVAMYSPYLDPDLSKKYKK